MKKVVLVFPDQASLKEFVRAEKLQSVEPDPVKRTLKGLMQDHQIEVACKEYGAVPKQISRI